MKWKPGGELDFLDELFADSPHYESDAKRQAFEDALDENWPVTGEDYARVCGDHALSGVKIGTNRIPPCLTRAAPSQYLRKELESQTQLVDYPVLDIGIEQSAIASAAREPVCWQPASDLIGTPPWDLANPKRKSVFATCRPGDGVIKGEPEKEKPEVGLVHEALEEAQAGFPGGVGGRINHRLAINKVPPEEMVVYVYRTECYNRFHVPVPPDADTHRYWRSRPASSPSAFGRTRPDLQDPSCRKCPNCAEDELVHENAPVPVDRLWVAIVKSEI